LIKVNKKKDSSVQVMMQYTGDTLGQLDVPPCLFFGYVEGEDDGVFWVVMPRGPVGDYERFGGTYFLDIRSSRKTTANMCVACTSLGSYVRKACY
jgi:hypothetical protein